MFLVISQNLQENTCARVSFLIKLQVTVWVSFLIKLRVTTCNFIKKETLAQVFSGECCEIFFKTPPVAASGVLFRMRVHSKRRVVTGRAVQKIFWKNICSHKPWEWLWEKPFIKSYLNKNMEVYNLILFFLKTNSIMYVFLWIFKKSQFNFWRTLRHLTES